MLATFKYLLILGALVAAFNCESEEKLGDRFLRFPNRIKCENRLKEFQYKNRNYFYSGNDPELKDKKYDWLDARNACRDRCMETVSFETQDKFEFIKAYIEKQNISFIWTAGRLCDFAGCEGRWDLLPKRIKGWLWTSSLSRIDDTNKVPQGWDYTPWSRTGHDKKPQPDNAEFYISQTSEGCLGVLNNQYNDSVAFHDIACYHRARFICEDSETLLEEADESGESDQGEETEIISKSISKSPERMKTRTPAVTTTKVLTTKLIEKTTQAIEITSKSPELTISEDIPTTINYEDVADNKILEATSTTRKMPVAATVRSRSSSSTVSPDTDENEIISITIEEKFEAMTERMSKISGRTRLITSTTAPEIEENRILSTTASKILEAAPAATAESLERPTERRSKIYRRTRLIASTTAPEIDENTIASTTASKILEVTPTAKEQPLRTTSKRLFRISRRTRLVTSTTSPEIDENIIASTVESKFLEVTPEVTSESLESSKSMSKISRRTRLRLRTSTFNPEKEEVILDNSFSEIQMPKRKIFIRKRGRNPVRTSLSPAELVKQPIDIELQNTATAKPKLAEGTKLFANANVTQEETLLIHESESEITTVKPLDIFFRSRRRLRTQP